MLDPWHAGPRRYLINAEGQRVLIGLSLEETVEFETLEGQPSLPECKVETNRRHPAKVKRWSELYVKHDEAWRVWITRSRTEPAANLAFP